MDDTIRQEEREICERWAKDHGFELEYFPLEKGLGRLTRPGSTLVQPARMSRVTYSNESLSEHALGLDFSLPEDRS